MTYAVWTLAMFTAAVFIALVILIGKVDSVHAEIAPLVNSNIVRTLASV